MAPTTQIDIGIALVRVGRAQRQANARSLATSDRGIAAAQRLEEILLVPGISRRLFGFGSVFDFF